MKMLRQNILLCIFSQLNNTHLKSLLMYYIYLLHYF